MSRKPNYQSILNALKLPEMERLGTAADGDAFLGQQEIMPDELDKQIAELSQLCYADFITASRAVVLFNVGMTSTINAFSESAGDPSAAAALVDSMELDLIAERLIYKSFFEKLKIACEKRVEVETSISFTFNGRSTRIEKQPFERKEILKTLDGFITDMAELLKGYKEGILEMTELCEDMHHAAQASAAAPKATVTPIGPVR